MTDMLTTERLTLRPPEPRDLDAIMAFYQSERSNMAGGHVAPFQAWKNAVAMLGHWAHRGYGLWAVTRDPSDVAMGLVGPFNPVGWPEPEVGWLMFEGAEGKGFAAEAARAALDDVHTRLGWRGVVHYIAPQNARSIALAERLGARQDPDAPVPFADKPCLVYRQPVREDAK